VKLTGDFVHLARQNPEVPGIGKFNIFMCQFPFDGDTDPPHGKAEFLPTYQVRMFEWALFICALDSNDVS
jgi:hypothetical protein